MPTPSRPPLWPKDSRPPARSAVSLFAGAGGLDIAGELAGFETRAAVELDPIARATLRANNHWFEGLSENALFEDIVTLDFDDLLDAAGFEPGEVDLVARWAALHSVLEVGLLARLQACRRRSQGFAA